MGVAEWRAGRTVAAVAPRQSTRRLLRAWALLEPTDAVARLAALAERGDDPRVFEATVALCVALGLEADARRLREEDAVRRGEGVVPREANAAAAEPGHAELGRLCVASGAAFARTAHPCRPRPNASQPVVEATRLASHETLVLDEAATRGRLFLLVFRAAAPPGGTRRRRRGGPRRRRLRRSSSRSWRTRRCCDAGATP